MEKNTIIAIVLSTIIIVISFTLFGPKSQPIAEQPVEQVEPEFVNTAGQTTGPAEPVILTPEIPAETDPVREEISVIETPLMRVEFTNRGGDIISFKLKEHSDKEEFVEMADNVTEKSRAFSVFLGDDTGILVDQLFNVKRISDTAIGFYQTLTIKNQDGTNSNFTLAKQYTFVPNDYMFELKISIDGDPSFRGLQFGQSSYTVKTSPQIGPEWRKEDRYEYRRFYYFQNGSKKKDAKVGNNQTKTVTDSFTWAGVAGKYFTLVAMPLSPIQKATFTTVPDTPGLTTAEMFLTRAPITANTNTDVWYFYAGPREEKALAKYNAAGNNFFGLNNTKLNQIVESSGILAPIEFLLKWIMELFYKVIPNWGVAIILMTILMRAIIFPLTKKSSEATKKMQAMQPKIQEIQQKYKDNPQKMNEEMAKFYKTVGYNPMSGCLPMLIQFPLIIAMFNLFNNYFEFRGAMFIPGWIPDLSVPDTVYTLPFTIPLVNWSEVHLLPVIYVFSQLLSQKLMQTPSATPQNNSMKFMMYGLPLIFFFIFYNAPSGLLIYWIFSNILALVQQVIVNRMMKNKEPEVSLEEVKTTKKKTAKK
ncbi:membrane protein insertase YidC [Brucepastera parasyntrophica]|uniref:membrane protein insertase YidC n=1 Tax=Brucepastera parasyntrophica TaxID=2880008 RepID=UPI00210C4E68|nr:membrane protein insertase YidC [Brucepastera parasyntrophica]ULQ58612.1 membrane protein insertase YidC [Brucepastera parasyntrophica]